LSASNGCRLFHARDKAIVGLAIVASLPTLVGCGDDAGARSSDAERVRDVITRSATSTDPADCTRLATQRFLEQTYLIKGPAAVDTCRHTTGIETGKPTAVRVSDVDVDGAVATARAAFEGGELDGQTLDVRSVREGQQWKVDRLVSFAGFDRTRFLRAARRELVRGPEAVTEPTAACIVARFDGRSDAELQRLYLGGDLAPILPVFVPCIADWIRTELAKEESIPRSAVECLVARLDDPPYAIVQQILIDEQQADRLIETVTLDCLAA